MDDGEGGEGDELPARRVAVGAEEDPWGAT
jgi:hypothetical protein